jgi:hypothetical protein
MKYLPILRELFTSDTVKFLIVGIVIAVAIGLFLKQQKQFVISLIASAIVYAACELASNIRTNFLVEILLVFVGTAALGCFVGFLVSLFIRMFRSGAN